MYLFADVECWDGGVEHIQRIRFGPVTQPSSLPQKMIHSRLDTTINLEAHVASHATVAGTLN